MFLEKLPRFSKTLSFRLTIWYAGIFTLSSFLAFSAFYFKIHSITMDRVDEELIEEAQDLSSVLEKDGIAQVKIEIAKEGEEEDEEDIFFRALSPDGKILASTNMSSWGDIEINFGKLKSEGSEGNEDHYILQTLHVPGRDHKARIISAMIGQKEIVQIGMILEDEEEYLTVFRNLFYLLFIISAFLSGLIGWFMARRGLRDVEQVTQTAMAISSGSPEKRVKIKHDYEEIDKLANAFNTMLDRIQAIHNAMREINDNIAHDLRSPLARIRGIAEMTLIQKKSTDEFNDIAGSIIEECDTLINMINTMLEITETEAGVGEQNIEEFDLAKVISEACEIFQPMARDKQITINIKSPDNIEFRGDLRKVQRTVTNILENAIKYTPEGGSVTISAREHNGMIDIFFEDTGIGVSQKDLPRIFERFYRGEKSRSNGGIGLGLSLAKAFTVALGGTITAKSTLGKGSLFVVSLPT